MKTNHMEIKTGVVCDRGLNPKRPVNQDHYLIMPERAVFAVFDGVGGQKAGEIASQTASETIEEAISNAPRVITDRMIIQAIEFANRDIFELADGNPEFRTMATTVALVYLSGDTAVIAHVGDSRVYTLQGTSLLRGTIDHTDLQDNVRAGIITQEEASSLPDDHVINRALGAAPFVDVECSAVPVPESVTFLLCSDGIYRNVTEDEIRQTLITINDPQRAADELKRIAYSRGADDNLTALVVSSMNSGIGSTQDHDVAGHTKSAQRSSIENTSTARSSADPSPVQNRGSRINVRLDADDPSTSGGPSSGRRPPAGGLAPIPHKQLYILIAVMLIAGAFYTGVRMANKLNQQKAGNALPASPSTMQVGRMHFEKAEYDEAVSDFNTALAHEPQNGEARYWLGRAQLEQHEYLEAARNFEQSLQHSPSLLDSYTQAAAAYEAAGNHVKAGEMLERFATEMKKRRTQPQNPG